jgi:hypothetical protein
MPQWEYLLVWASDGKVTHVNDERVGKTGFTGAQGEPLHDYLNRMGAEGWEAVGYVAPTTALTSILLKRPKQVTSP